MVECNSYILYSLESLPLVALEVLASIPGLVKEAIEVCTPLRAPLLLVVGSFVATPAC